MDMSFEQALEDAKWDAEFAENREADLLKEYMVGKVDGGEQGHDACFPNLTGPGATVWISRAGKHGFICYFDTMEEGFEFGHAFLKEHTSECIGSKGDSLTGILLNGMGNIGCSNNLSAGIYKNKSVSDIVWANMSGAFIVSSKLAMVLGSNKDPLNTVRLFASNV